MITTYNIIHTKFFIWVGHLDFYYFPYRTYCALCTVYIYIDIDTIHNVQTLERSDTCVYTHQIPYDVTESFFILFHSCLKFRFLFFFLWQKTKNICEIYAKYCEFLALIEFLCLETPTHFQYDTNCFWNANDEMCEKETDSYWCGYICCVSIFDLCFFFHRLLT